jgi:hypothetical protein
MMGKGAKFSPDRIHRYRLWRIWNKNKAPALFIGLNPSTADENADDPTIRRCIGFASRWGFGGLLMGNIFAYRSTYPVDLRNPDIDPLGQENDAELCAMNAEAGLTILCWGNHGVFKNRGDAVLLMFPSARHFGFTKEMQPKHPLYLPKDAPLLEIRSEIK